VNYNLENKVLLSEDSEYKSLYQWSLQEFDKDDNKIGRDLIPWNYSLYFTASELRYSDSLDIYKSEDTEKDSDFFVSEFISFLARFSFLNFNV